MMAVQTLTPKEFIMADMLNVIRELQSTNEAEKWENIRNKVDEDLDFDRKEVMEEERQMGFDRRRDMHPDAHFGPYE